MSKKNIITIVFLLIISVVIVLIPLMTIKDTEFAGADGQAEEMISEVNPEYTPWFESLIELPGSETETLLFCLQAALGAGLIGYGFGYFVARKKFNKDIE